MPIGGTRGRWRGAIEGLTIGQILGGQIGLISNVLEHKACTEPFTHAHLQLADTCVVCRRLRPKMKIASIAFISNYPI